MLVPAREREGVVPKTEEKKKGRGEWGDRATGREKRELRGMKRKKRKKRKEERNILTLASVRIFCDRIRAVIRASNFNCLNMFIFRTKSIIIFLSYQRN
jgi:hypothetical protein